MTQRCGNCYFCVPIEQSGIRTLSGTCHYEPPEIHFLEDGRTQGAWPPVSLDFGWCGKWRWRWFPRVFSSGRAV